MSESLGFIDVSGHRVGIVELTEILQEVASLGIHRERLLRKELLRRVKRRNYIPRLAETSYAEALLQAYRNYLGKPSKSKRKEERSGCTIEILGPGCPRCDRLLMEVKNILAEIQLAAAVVHVKDPNALLRYGPLPMPALVINGRVHSAGQVPTQKKIKTWLQDFC
jgi:hypothetical protein